MTKSVSYAACHGRPAQPFRMPNPVSCVSGSLVGSCTWVHVPGAGSCAGSGFVVCLFQHSGVTNRSGSGSALFM